MCCFRGSSSNKLKAFEVAILLLLVSLSTSPSTSVHAAATLEEVALHATPEDCWSVVYGNVYDLTAYAPNHRRGGGPDRVYSMCGIDGTDLYDEYHGDNKEWLDEISTIENLGPLLEEEADPPTDPPLPATDPPVVATVPPVTTEPPAATSPPDPTVVSAEPPLLATDPPVFTNAPTVAMTNARTMSPTTAALMQISIEELSQHNSPGVDCWAAYLDNVYDLTTYVHPDPPGNSVISCGVDDTAAFLSIHDESYLNRVQDLVVGKLQVAADITLEPITPVLTNPPSEPPAVLISMEELSQHNSPGIDCWVAYFNNVYNLTTYLHPDPPGNSVISCGVDDTAAFASIHEESYLDGVQDLMVGELEVAADTTVEPTTAAPANPPSEPPVVLISMEELSQHNSPGIDCWVAYFNNVYNLTTYLHPDPPGNSVISCGVDDTAAFASVHEESYLDRVQDLVVGKLEVAAETTVEPTIVDDFISLEQLQGHDTSGDCWVSYYGDVYEMSEYAPRHPAGSGIIFVNCGGDGTEEYAEYHNQTLLASVQQYYVGKLDPEAVFDESTTQPQELTAVSLEQLELHNSTDDCWVAYYDEVYDLTTYGHPVPPGMSVIYMACGKDGTRNYTAVHPRDYLEEVEHMKVGWLESASVRIKGIGSAIVLASLVHFFSLGL